jgi:hypothetical protein
VVRVGARVLRRMGWQVGDEVELRYSARRGVIELRHTALSRALRSEAQRRRVALRALERKARQALAEWRRVP